MDLKKEGLDFIKVEQTEGLFFGKKIGEMSLRFENMAYFFDLIKNHLQTENAVINAIKEIIRIADSKGEYKKPFLIQPEIYHISTAYNLDNIE
jgi:5-hydroxyisourate hydrolase-like protein (transthyretin family)